MGFISILYQRITVDIVEIIPESAVIVSVYIRHYEP